MNTILKRRFPPILGAILAAFLLFCGVASVYNVPKTITSEDINYIEQILNSANYEKEKRKATKTFNHEISQIVAIQSSAYSAAPKVSLIPYSTPREPKNLFETGSGYCGDRARYLDKAFRYLGYKTRYASLYENEEEHSLLSTMLSKGTKNRSESHALIEVKTSKGWIIIDTRRKWVSLTEDGAPIDLITLQGKGTKAYKWHGMNQEEPWPLLEKSFHIFYELYSRHGQFYPPYTKYIPDINWAGFIKHNLLR